MIDAKWLWVIGILAFVSLVSALANIVRIDNLETQLINAKAQILAHENHRCPTGCDEAVEHYRTCACTKTLGGGE